MAQREKITFEVGPCSPCYWPWYRHELIHHDPGMLPARLLLGFLAPIVFRVHLSDGQNSQVKRPRRSTHQMTGLHAGVVWAGSGVPAAQPYHSGPRVGGGGVVAGWVIGRWVDYGSTSIAHCMLHQPPPHKVIFCIWLHIKERNTGPKSECSCCYLIHMEASIPPNQSPNLHTTPHLVHINISAVCTHKKIALINICFHLQL